MGVVSYTTSGISKFWLGYRQLYKMLLKLHSFQDEHWCISNEKRRNVRLIFNENIAPRAKRRGGMSLFICESDISVCHPPPFFCSLLRLLKTH